MKGKTRRILVWVLCLVMALCTLSISAMAADRCGVTFEQMAQGRPKDGIVEERGHYFIYDHGTMLTGKVRHEGRWYYCHETDSPDYPRGSMVRAQMRIEGGKRWYAYAPDGHMHTENVYCKRNGEWVLEVELRKDNTVAYIYDISTLPCTMRYSTYELRWQYKEANGRWRTVESMQSVPDFVDYQK